MARSTSWSSPGGKISVIRHPALEGAHVRRGRVAWRGHGRLAPVHATVNVFDGESSGDGTSGRPMTRAGVVIVVAALVLGGAVMMARTLTGSASTAGGPGRTAAGGPGRTAAVSASATPEPPTPSAPADPNAGWFVEAQRGARMQANDVIDDPDLFPLYFADAEAEVYGRQGVDVVRVRSYYTGSTGGAVLTVIPAARPRAVLRGLDRIEGGLGRAYPPLPEGRIRRQVVQMESTRAHDVYAHFCTISFVEGRFAVVVEAYGLSGPVGRRRAVWYATAQRDLLAARG